jgi:hypothetical protein
MWSYEEFISDVHSTEASKGDAAEGCGILGEGPTEEPITEAHEEVSALL